MTLRAYRVTLLIVVAFTAAIVVTTSASLPGAVVANAARAGVAVATQSRESYRFMMLILTVFVPLLAWAGSGLLPRVAGFFIRIPNRQYWLAPERRVPALDWLERHSIVTGGGVALFALALHLVNLQGNLLTPARFEAGVLRVLGVSWVAFVVASAIALQVHFRRVPKGPQEGR